MCETHKFKGIHIVSNTIKANVSAISSYSNTQLTEWHIIVPMMCTFIYIHISDSQVQTTIESVQAINLPKYLRKKKGEY